MPESVRVSLIQTKAFPDPAANLNHSLSQVRKAAHEGGQVVCLQELFKTPYFCQTKDPKNFDLAETVPGPTTQAFSKLAAELGVVVIVPIFEKSIEGKYYNSACIFDTDGALAGRYRKMHIPDEPSYYEKFYFLNGDLGFMTFQTKVAKIGLLICWDQWFPEAARICALQGAQILFYPSAIGWHDTEPMPMLDLQLANWILVHQAHAVTNGCFVAAINRAGKEGALKFWGNSFITDPYGRVLARADQNEAIVTADCDLSQIDTVRREWPFLRHRRTNSYNALAST